MSRPRWRSFFEGQASTTRLDRQFDQAICLCEGAFSLLEQGMDPVQYHLGTLRNIHAMLKPGGMFLLTALNGFLSARCHSDEDVASGRFDVMNLAYTEELPTSGGATVTVIEEGFMPSELKALLEAAGFSVLSLWGGTAGSWNKQPLKLDEIELMVLARRR